MTVVLKIFAFLMSHLPWRTVLALGRVLGFLFYSVAGKQRRRALTELQRCYPEKNDSEIKQIARRVFMNMALNFVELFRWIGGRDQEMRARVRAVDEDNLTNVLAEGKGAVVLTAHLGNWDLMGLWAADHIPLTIISKEIKNPGLNRFWMEARKKWNVNIVPAHNSYRDCLKVLKRNGCLGFILDQNMTRDEGIFVDFFGKPACTTPGLAMLAAHAQSPVVPAFIVRRGEEHVVTFLPPIAPPVNRLPETIREATQAYTKVIESAIKEHPDQWIWMHRRWRTQPEGEKPEIRNLKPEISL